MGRVLYSAVVLTEHFHKALLDNFQHLIPEGWKVFAHHMTINLGPLKEDMKATEGVGVVLKLTHIGKSDKAIALKCDTDLSHNRIAHITLAVNVNEGGKPVDSNKIEVWEPLYEEIFVMGEITEVKAQ